MNAPTWPNLSALLADALSVPLLDPRPRAQYTTRDLRAWADKYARTDPELAAYLRSAAPSNRPDVHTRNGNVALHCLIATHGKRHKRQHKAQRADALARVALAWQVTPAYVQEILTTQRAAAQTWLDNLLEYINYRSAKSDEDILQALDADLVTRAAAMPRQRRRT
jgi:hypothetical protein